jgi:hypothetical protein
VQEGLVHKFRLRAKNQFGWGPYSLSAEVIPCNVPGEMQPVITVVDNVYVKITWTQPESNGAEITAYRVLLLANDNISWLESEFCQNTDATLVTQLSCYVPMSEITGDVF